MASVVAAWPTVALDEVLTLDTDYIDAPESRQYPKLSVRLYGKGVVLDTPADGALLKMQRHQLAHAGQVILSEIWGKKGAIGIVPAEGEGALCTSHFFLFDINQDRLDPCWLQAIFTANYLQEQLDGEARGTTGYAAVRPKHLLTATIPLPPLDEQRRIVARIETLAARIAEARWLRQAASDDLNDLVSAEEMRLWPNECLVGAAALADVTVFLSRGRQSAQGESDHFLIKTQHVQQGHYVPSHLTLAPEVASKVSDEALVQPNDILIACSAAGCLGRVAQFTDSSATASTDTHVAIARANADIVLPTYLYFYLRGAQGQFQLRSRERGDWTKEKIGFRLLELNLADLRRVPVPVPSIAEQQRIVAHVCELYAQVEGARQLQVESSAYIDALLPSLLDKAFRGEL